MMMTTGKLIGMIKFSLVNLWCSDVARVVKKFKKFIFGTGEASLDA